MEVLGGEGMPEEDLYELISGEQMKAWRLSSNDSYVTRDEFCLAMLLRLDKISSEELHLVQNTFKKLDLGRTGRLDARAFRQWQQAGHRSMIPANESV